MKLASVLLVLVLFAPLQAFARCDATPQLNLNSKDALIDKLIEPSQADTVIQAALASKIDRLKSKIEDQKLQAQPLQQLEEIRARCTVQMRRNFAQFLAAHYSEAEIRDLTMLVGPGKLTTHSAWETGSQAPLSPLAEKYKSNAEAAMATMQLAVADFDQEADELIKKSVEENAPSTVNPYMPPINTTTPAAPITVY